MNKNALISLRGIRVDFDDEPVLKGIDLDIMDKEFITFLRAVRLWQDNYLAHHRRIYPTQGG